MAALRSLALCVVLALLAGALAGCRTKPFAPYAWQPTAEDPRLSVRVPAGTPGSEEVPEREQLHPNCRATLRDEVEWEDPRLSCCPEEESEEEFLRNEISLFLGFTGVRGGDGFTTGVAYHRMLRHNFGLSVWGEFVFGEAQVPVFGAGVVFRPTEKARILVSGGIEIDDEVHHGGNSPTVEALFRIGAMYSIAKVGGVDVFPAIYLDLVQHAEPVLLVGIEFGKEF